MAKTAGIKMSATSYVIDLDPILLDTLQHDCQSRHEAEILSNDTLYCPGIFDGWACWNSTPAGTTAFQRCPYYVAGFTPRKTARRECRPDGTWFRHPDSNSSWSNYTTCVDTESFEVWQKVNSVYVIGYSVSLAALVIALLIYCTFRSLRCSRVEIHKNLFTAFVITNIMFLVWHSRIVPDADLLLDNPVWCQIWHVMAHYFLLSNHLWMLFEGFYLHAVLVVTFIDEKRLIQWFYVLGWCAPLPFIIAYVVFRVTRIGELGDLIDIKACWLRENNEAKWILVTPIILSLVANLIFLINIVRVLFKKLRSMPGGHPAHSCKRRLNRTQELERHELQEQTKACEDALLINVANGEANGAPRANIGTRADLISETRRTSTVTFSKTTPQLGKSDCNLKVTSSGPGGGESSVRLLNGHKFSTDAPGSIRRTNNHCPCGYRKAVRATFLLIPLLGIHYILVPFYEEERINHEDLSMTDEDWSVPDGMDLAYQMLLAVTASFQGLFVALLFCLLNAEVIQVFKNKWNQRRARNRDSLACSRTVSLKVFRPPDPITRTNSWEREQQ